MCLFTIDDTGCPTSQSVSPSKTPSGSERSTHGSPTLPERKTKVKRVRVMTEGSGEARSAPRHKRELRSAMKARGKETADECNNKQKVFVFHHEKAKGGKCVFLHVSVLQIYHDRLYFQKKKVQVCS